MWKRKLIAWWTVLVAGFLLGSLGDIVLRFPVVNALQEIAVTGLLGSATAFCFWLIWKLGSDHSSGQRPTTHSNYSRDYDLARSRCIQSRNVHDSVMFLSRVHTADARGEVAGTSFRLTGLRQPIEAFKA
jgi:hypothetical protein